MVSDNFVAVGASMLVVHASRNAERNTAAAKPAADETEDEAEDPGQGSLKLLHARHASMAAVLALNSCWVVRPELLMVGGAVRWT